MSTNEPTPESGGGEAPDPFAPLRDAGFDPDNTNWAEVAAKASYVDALTDPNRHMDTLENSLREWGHLDEGQSLSDFFADDEPEPTPMSPQQQPGGIIGYDVDGDPIYSAPPQQFQQPPAQPQFDPQAMEQRIMDMVKEANANTQREVMATQMARDLEVQMESAKSQYNLNDEESAFLWSNVRDRIANMNIVDPSQMRGIVDQSWKQIDALANARLARIAQEAGQRPQTTDMTGPAPTGDAGVPGGSTWSEMMGETARRLGMQPE